MYTAWPKGRTRREGEGGGEEARRGGREEARRGGRKEGREGKGEERRDERTKQGWKKKEREKGIDPSAT